nr:hypothetical protein [Tanacetum cinerariifolium]
MTQAGKICAVKAAKNKNGATRTHNLLSSMKGGYEYVHGTTNDFKNHQRDVNVFIGESDAKMLINKMKNRKMYVLNFTFQYKVEKNELVTMFWDDEVAKCNYKEFEDIISFDATFNSNKQVIHNDSMYIMVFVPFIGIDNHRKCVTLGSGMLLHKDTQSYTWPLKAFMTAFIKEPTLIVTYQDGAMKKAIEAVFTKSKHRLCMWHITQKIPSKDEVKADVLNPPLRNTGDVIGDIFSISKPNKLDVQNPTKARNKGERLKSEREKALKVRVKPMKVYGYYNEKTNKHI